MKKRIISERVVFALSLLMYTAGVIALWVALVHTSGKADDARRTASDCVTATARAQGYTGNVYGSEAWRLFIGECAK